MKKLLLLMLLFCTSFVYAQNDKTTQTFYCEMIGSGNFAGNKIKISFDFGMQAFGYRASNENQLLDEKGKSIQFLSMIDALNYMSAKGWKLHSVYSAAIKGTGAHETYRYILEKQGSDIISVMKGINLSDTNDIKQEGSKSVKSDNKAPFFKRNMTED